MPLGAWSLWPGEGQHVDGELSHVDGNLAHGLNRVGVKENPPFVGNACQFLDRKNNTGFVVGPHDADNGRVVGQVFDEVVHVQPPLAVHGYKGHPVAFLERCSPRLITAGCSTRVVMICRLSGLD